MRQIVLDTETTGLEIAEGHRILELGCVEIVDRRLTRRRLHHYVNPGRNIDEGALQVHGITADFLKDKPVFADVFEEFLSFVDGAELVIHNAEFDVNFINHEMKLMSQEIGRNVGVITDYCRVVDSLDIARTRHPGQRNSLDALSKRYSVERARDLHGALLDAEILADVYLLLTGGQVTLGLDEDASTESSGSSIRRLPASRPRLRVIRANEEELAQHERKLDELDGAAENGVLWRQLELPTV